MMDQTSQETLERIVKLDPLSLTVEDIGFLRARSSYLNDVERAKFADVLEGPAPTVPGKPSTPAEPKLNYNELKKEAKALGLKPSREMKAPQIKAMIDEKKIELEAETEDRAEQERKDAEALAAAEEAKKSETGHKGNFTQKPEDEV